MEEIIFIIISSLICLTSGASADVNFDYFTYAQSWPPGTCAAGKFERHTCSIPSNIQTWLVHGLWPSVVSGKEPFNCNSTPFDIKKVASIQNKMEQFWPNLYTDTAHESFWEHEWSKHGTCCTDLPATSTELNYFTEGLKLNQIYNISSMLSKSNIVPSTTVQYSYDDFINAIKKETGFEPVIECAYIKLPDGTGFHLIEQIEICLDKQFRPVTCYQDEGNQQRKTRGSETGNHRFAEDGTLRFESHDQMINVVGREPQSNCPRKESFNYPPIVHS